MNDPAIRSAYIRHLSLQRKDYNPKKDILISEMGLCRGISRVDLAVINGVIHGYEIKSDVDNLRRLSSQIAIYEKYFSFLTVITTETHIRHLRSHLPKWIGITKAEFHRGKISFIELRKAKKNSHIEKQMIVQLLWRQEALAVLENMGADKGVRSKNKDAIWSKLATLIDTKDLIAEIKNTLSIRSNWQVVPVRA
jgi:hypothetical protein